MASIKTCILFPLLPESLNDQIVRLVGAKTVTSPLAAATRFYGGRFYHGEASEEHLAEKCCGGVGIWERSCRFPGNGRILDGVPTGVARITSVCLPSALFICCAVHREHSFSVSIIILLQQSPKFRSYRRFRRSHQLQPGVA